MPCIRAPNKQVGRDFYLDAADERKSAWWKDGDGGWERRYRRRKQRKKDGVLLERSSRPSLHYITEMLRHWWHRRAGRRTGPWDDVINNQSENSGGRLSPASSWGWNSGISENVFSSFQNHRAVVSCVLFPGVIFRLVLKQIHFRPVSRYCHRAKGKQSWLSKRGEGFINLAQGELSFN